MLQRRLQILVDEARYQRLLSIARQRKVSVAAIVRDAIDNAVPAHSVPRSAASDTILSASRMAVPDASDLHLELEALRAGQQ